MRLPRYDHLLLAIALPMIGLFVYEYTVWLMRQIETIQWQSQI